MDSRNRNSNRIEQVNEQNNDQVNDPINHPAHYTSGSIEVIDFLEDQGFGFHLANAVKYIARAGKKDPDKTVEDLSKAVWYINRYIGLIEKAERSAEGNLEKGDTPSLTNDLSAALIRAEKGGAI